jgi:hypothetical protein
MRQRNPQECHDLPALREEAFQRSWNHPCGDDRVRGGLADDCHDVLAGCGIG